MNRAERRAAKRVLRDERCASCGGKVDEEAHEGCLILPGGREIEHWVCAACAAESASGPSGLQAVARRVHLRLTPTEGGA